MQNNRIFSQSYFDNNSFFKQYEDPPKMSSHKLITQKLCAYLKIYKLYLIDILLWVDLHIHHIFL